MPELALPQGTVRYREDGTGPTVVFVHGALVDGRLWEPVVDRLRDRARCLVPDLPLGSHTIPMHADADLSPHGQAAIVARFLEALDLRDVTLVGNDTGGAICQLVAVEHPERLGRLVLTDCDAFEDFPPKAFRPLIAAAKVPGALTAMLAPLRLEPPRRLPVAYGWLTKRPVPKDVMDGWILRCLDDGGIMRDLRKALSAVKPTILLDNTPKLRTFDKPVLLAWAREDKFFKIEHARRLAAIFPDARVQEIDDAYTFVSWDQPDRLAELIGSFVADRRSSGAQAAEVG
jgi:pimeloyl-ACP methyl ester carboxylesterase